MASKSAYSLGHGMHRLRRNLLSTGMFFENETQATRKTVSIFVTLVPVLTSAVPGFAQADNDALGVAHLDLSTNGLPQGKTAEP